MRGALTQNVTCDHKRRSQNVATVMGAAAVVLWSFGASCAYTIKTIPIFQVLTITFILSFLTACVRISWAKAWYQLKHPWWVWAICVLSLTTQQFLYLQSFRFGQPAQIDVIIHSWPMILMIMSHFVIKEALNTRYIVALLIGFLSIVALKSGSEGFFNASALQGYVYAIMSACLWAVYCLFIRSKPYAIDHAVGFYYGVASLVMLIAHMTFESFVVPSFEESLILLFIGIGMTGGAYSLWVYGVKSGDLKTLSIISYLNPVLSVVWLWCFGYSDLSYDIYISLALLIFAAYIGSKRKKSFQR